MSVSFELINDEFRLKKLKLPTRFYRFEDNYIKLLNIGEGIFPHDKIATNITLKNSSLILASESAQKVYPCEFGLNLLHVRVQNSNFEGIFDELILFKDSKLIQFLRVEFDESSTFFYSEILSKGRSYENHTFTHLKVKNSFTCRGVLEYIERFDISGEKIKNFGAKHFAKIYLRTPNNEAFIKLLNTHNFFAFSQNRLMILGVVSSKDMSELKKIVEEVWLIYREFFGNKKFNLGKR